MSNFFELAIVKGGTISSPYGFDCSCRQCGVYSQYKDYVDLKATDSGDSQFFCERKCGSLQPFVVTVNASYFVISFESTKYYVGDDKIRFPPPDSIGFFATYEFTNSTVEDGVKIASASESYISYLLCTYVCTYYSLKIATKVQIYVMLMLQALPSK